MTYPIHSENINEISTALSKMQGELKSVQKDGENPHFRSKFSTLNSHWDVCRETLSKNGLSISQVASFLPDGKSILVSILSHSSGQWFKSYYPLNPVKNDPQGMGSCLTYARRYMLSAMVGTSSDDDDGHEATHPKKPEPVKVDEKKIIRDFMEKVLPEDDANEEAWINQYLQAHAKINKCPVYVSIQKYEDIEKFKLHLSQWKEKQIKSEEE